MSEFQLTHIALVGARMSAFRPYGYAKRNDLSFHRVAPDLGERDPEQFNRTEVNTMLRDHLPLWIHNIIADPTFPGRRRLLMPRVVSRVNCATIVMMKWLQRSSVPASRVRTLTL